MIKQTSKWESLALLRDRYLLPPKPGAPRGDGDDYWDTPGLLALYDETLGARIGWKWHSVLRELQEKNWSPPLAYQVLDWGCGTGQASRAFVSHFSTTPPRSICLYDRSPVAAAFATTILAPLKIELTTEPSAPGPDIALVLLVSHVLNELSSRAKTELAAWVAKADAVVWLEPGTPESSRELIAVRESCRRDFTAVAPCPHQETCGLQGHRKDWCHFFAEVPSAAHQSAEWREFANQLGIDLRSLPVSYLCLQRTRSLAPSPPNRGRLIGRPRLYKGYAKGVICRSGGVNEERFLKRDPAGPYHVLKGGGFALAIPDNKQ